MLGEGARNISEFMWTSKLKQCGIVVSTSECRFGHYSPPIRQPIRRSAPKVLGSASASPRPTSGRLPWSPVVKDLPGADSLDCRVSTGIRPPFSKI